MNPKLYPVGTGGTLRACVTDRFKAGMLSVSAVIPMDRESVCMAPLLLSVLRRGTEKFPTMAEINRRLEYLWGTEFSLRSYRRGNCLIVGFAADLLDPSYLPAGAEDVTDGVIDLMREILFHPLLDADGLLSAKYVESEKELQCVSIRSMKNHPRSYAAERFRSLLFSDEPSGLPSYGTEEQTMAITREELTAYWRRWIDALRPDCFYVGPSDPAPLREKLERAFPCGVEWKKSPVLCGMGALREARGLVVEEALPVEQSQLVIGLRGACRADGADVSAYVLLNEMLGVSPVSRLFVYVREKKSLCYSCSSAYISHSGAFMIQCGIKRENRKKAEREILRQIRLLSEGKFTQTELDAAKKSLADGYRRLSDGPVAMESFYYGRALLGIPSTPEACSEAIARITSEEIRRAAASLKTDVVYFLEGTLGEGDFEDDED